MEYNDGSQFRVVTDPGAYLQARDMFEFRACSATTISGKFQMYVDTAFAQHRATLAGLRALVMYQYVYPDFTPEAQADFFCSTIGSLKDNEMVMLDIETAANIPNPADFASRWLAKVDAALGTLPWVYVPQALSKSLTRSFLGNRIIKAPRYSGDATQGLKPTWPYDVWQYSDRGTFPGCATTGDVNTTTWTPEQLLARCAGSYSPIRTAMRPRVGVA